MSYRGKAPLTVATQANGSHVYVYAGGLVPDTVKDEELKRLVDEGFIESEGGEEKKTSSRSSSK